MPGAFEKLRKTRVNSNAQTQRAARRFDGIGREFLLDARGAADGLDGVVKR